MQLFFQFKIVLIKCYCSFMCDYCHLMLTIDTDSFSIVHSNATEHINTTDHTGFYLLFLKRLCEILLEMGKQLCALWVNHWTFYLLVFYSLIRFWISLLWLYNLKIVNQTLNKFLGALIFSSMSIYQARNHKCVHIIW